MKKKRIISFLLTLVMVVSLFPTAATFAGGTPSTYVTVKDDGIYDKDGVKQDSPYNGLSFTAATATTPATLTMENFNIDYSFDSQTVGSAIKSLIAGTLKLEVKGENTIKVDNLLNDQDRLEREERSIAIETAGDLEIICDDNASLTITGVCNGIVADGDITIQDKADITMELYGCYSTGITVLGDNCLTINGADTKLDISAACYGILARVEYDDEGSVVINDGTINLTAITPPEYDNNWDGGIAIDANDITITGGNVTALAKGVDSHDFFVNNNFTVTGGTVSLEDDEGNNASVWNIMTLGSATKPATIDNAEKISVAYGQVNNGWGGLSAVDSTNPVVIKFVELPSYTVNFEANGGLPAPASQQSYGKVVEPDAMTKADSVFEGWYKDAKCFQRFDMANDIIASDITLYAKWVSNKADITGEVRWKNNDAPVADATVNLYSGAFELASVTTDSSGKFMFADIPEGNYNLVAEQHYNVSYFTYYSETTAEAVIDSSGCAFIDGVDCQNNPIIYLKSNPSHVSSVVTIEKGTPEVIVKNFNEVAQQYEEPNTIVKVELIVESKDEDDVPSTDKTAIENKAAEINNPASLCLEYIDMRVKKTVNPADQIWNKTTTDIHDTVDTITIVIPFDTEDKENINIYRYHDGVATAIPSTQDANGEFAVVESGCITLHARYFSTYAIGYEVATPLIPVDIPTAVTGLVYDGTEQTGVPEGTGYTVTGNTATNAGDSYEATATLKDGYIWSDETTEAKRIPWAIDKQTLAWPTVESKVYNGQHQIADIDTTGKPYVVKINVGGINAGRYPVGLEITDLQNYKWEGLDSSLCSLVFTITGAPAYTVDSFADEAGNRVIASADTAEAGTKISLKVSAADKYSLKTLNVKTVSGASVTLASDNTFVMPAADVVINALFEKEKDTPIIIIIPRLTPTPTEAPAPTEAPKPTESPEPTKTPESTKEPEVTEYPTEEDFLLNSIRLNKKYKVTQPEDIIDIKWGKVKDADGYLVYAEYCGTSFKQVAKITGNDILTYSLDSLNGEPINQADEFKIMVKAYKVIDGQDVIIGKSIHAHIAGSDSVKYTNATGIKVTSSTKPVLSIGETSSITATVLLEDKSKKPLSNNHARELRFMSANPNVAVVADDGTITAVGKGKCNIYVYARNGFAKKISVTVK